MAEGFAHDGDGITQVVWWFGDGILLAVAQRVVAQGRPLSRAGGDAVTIQIIDDRFGSDDNGVNAASVAAAFQQFGLDARTGLQASERFQESSVIDQVSSRDLRQFSR